MKSAQVKIIKGKENCMVGTSFGFSYVRFTSKNHDLVCAGEKISSTGFHIGEAFANELNMHEYQRVTFERIEICEEVQRAIAVVDCDDKKLIADYQANIVNQLRRHIQVINKDIVYPFQFRGKLLRFHITHLETMSMNNYGALTAKSMLTIQTQSQSFQNNIFTKSMNYLKSFIPRETAKSDTITKIFCLKPNLISDKLLNQFATQHKELSFQPNVLFVPVNKDPIPNEAHTGELYLLDDFSDGAVDMKSKKKICRLIEYLDSSSCVSILPGDNSPKVNNCYVHPAFFREIGEHSILCFIPRSVENCFTPIVRFGGIFLKCESQNGEYITECFKNFVLQCSARYPLIINNNAQIDLRTQNKTFECTIELDGTLKNGFYTSLSQTDFYSLQIRVKEIDKNPCEDEFALPDLKYEVNIRKPLIISLVNSLEWSFKNSNVFSSNVVLVCGSQFCGKSTFLREVVNKLIKSNVTPFWSKCKELSTQKIANVKSYLSLLFNKCVANQPSVVVLDDAEFIFPLENENELHNNSTINNRRTTAFAIDSINSIVQEGHKVVFIFATSSEHSLSKLLVKSRFVQFFKSRFDIAILNENDRREFVNRYLPKLSQDSSECKEILQRTKHYSLLDLKRLLASIDESNVKKSLADYKPLLVKDRNDVIASTKFDDVVGLKDVKDTLIELYIWPQMYPEQFSKCDLKSSAAVLLYGLPGTGKTLLARALANESSMNFIPVKGPELLSKYIGSSEEAVRDLFIRAKNSKPALIFFDELDSLAPKRGHDNTGVTDRVVNQLLTELDGVDSLEEVYILGASSRPDLIDRAVLRPGRFDKCVRLHLPEHPEVFFKEIIKNIPNSLTDDHFKDLKENLKGYTPADLSGLLYSCQLEAYKQNVKTDNKSSTKVLKEVRSESYRIGFSKLPRVEFVLDDEHAVKEEPSSKESSSEITFEIVKKCIEHAKKSTSGTIAEEYERAYLSFESPHFEQISNQKATVS